MDHAWENFVSINTQLSFEPHAIGTIKEFRQLDDGTVLWNEALLSRDSVLETDVAPIPSTQDREGYYGDNHFNYWASGLRDLSQILEVANYHNLPLGDVLDFGCASGRLLRHYHYCGLFRSVQGCDLNRLHVDWCAHYLPREIRAFNSTSIPHLPLADNSISLISAFSVFTHIEAFEDTWLMEFRRILRPGGFAWITVHADRTWREVREGWPLHDAIKHYAEFSLRTVIDRVPKDRVVLRARGDGSYSSNVFYSNEHIRRRFGQFLDVIDIFPARPAFQDVVLLKKT